jgi:hypothetical protein
LRAVVFASAALVVLSACGDPLAGVERFSDDGVAIPEPDVTRSVAAGPEELARSGGLFSGLFQTESDPATPTAASTQTDTASATETAAENAPAQSRGLFGGLFSGARQTTAEDGTQVASLGAPQGATMSPARAQPRDDRGLFGGLAPAPGNGPDRVDVAPGTRLPFGQIARVCEARDLGTRIERAARFALHDSTPGSTGPRTFYVTGFSDGCPRQFTAALAMFGDPEMHETLRYGRPSEKYPYSTTDKAYEKVKASVCGVSRRTPCGSRIGALSRDTVFISTYERFTDNGRWADILLHDGAVLAAALKDL